MHPGLTWSLYRQQRQELDAKIAGHQAVRACQECPARGGRRRHAPRRWSVTWTRLSSAHVPGAKEAGRSWMIIISAGRPGRPGPAR